MNNISQLSLDTTLQLSCDRVSRYSDAWEPLLSLGFHILEGSKSLSSSKFIRREKLSFTASISSKEQGLRIQRFPRASGSSSKYFFIYQEKKRDQGIILWQLSVSHLKNQTNKNMQKNQDIHFLESYPQLLLYKLYNVTWKCFL